MGVFSTVGGYHEYRGGYLEYRGGYHDKCGGYLEYRGVFSTVGDIMSTVGVILSTVGGYLEYRGDVQYRGGYHDARGGISWVPWRVFSTVGGKVNCYLSTPWYWTPPRYSWYPPHASWYPPTCIMISPHGTQISKDGIPPRYSWYPPRASWYPPRYWTSPTVLKITPHGTHDIPPRYWTPPTVLKISPHIYHDIPHGTEHPHGTQDIPPRYSWYPPTVLMISPTVLMISPTVLNTPHGTEHPHGTAHTLYRVRIRPRIFRKFHEKFCYRFFVRLSLKWQFFPHFIDFLRVFRELFDNIPKILREFHYAYTIKLLLTNCRSICKIFYSVRTLKLLSEYFAVWISQLVNKSIVLSAKIFTLILKGTSAQKRLSSNERAWKMLKNEPLPTSMRQMVLEIFHFKVRNLGKMDIAIL